MSDLTYMPTPIEHLPKLIENIKNVRFVLSGMQNRWETISSRHNDNTSIETPTGPKSIAYFREQMIKERATLHALETELFDYIEKACVYYFGQGKELSDTFAKAENARQIAAEALRMAKDTAAISSGEPFVAFFQKRIKDLFWPVFGWGIASTGFLVAALGFLFRQKMPEAPVTDASIALFISNRAIVTAILVGAAIWCARIFRATYERREVYSHRAVITRTYQSFEASALDTSSKNLIAREAIRHIFSPLPGEKEDGTTKSEIEMLKDIIVPLVKKPAAE